MKKLRVGYSALSNNFKAPGDRRRLVFWAKERGHEVVTDLSSKVDIIIASVKSDFGSKSFENSKVPVLFDLVDAYLSPSNTVSDLTRGVAKAISGEISGPIQPFSKHISNFCEKVDGVICSSAEQEILIRKYNENTHVILDSHDEIPFLGIRENVNQNSGRHRILWEGQPATIGGIRKVSDALKNLSLEHRIELSFITDEEYFLVLGRYFKNKTINTLKTQIPSLIPNVELDSWSIPNLLNAAKRSDFAMIPINLEIPMQRLKPENRLLIMWRLGLPCLTSSSPAYNRVAAQADVDATCDDSQDWYNKFSRLISEPTFALAEIEKGQLYVRENHSAPILLAKWDRAVQSVLRN